eukprot:scaffold5558_cov17-Prasinocladus_malaysianus.AAC.1
MEIRVGRVPGFCQVPIGVPGRVPGTLPYPACPDLPGTGSTNILGIDITKPRIAQNSQCMHTYYPTCTRPVPATRKYPPGDGSR